MTPRKYRFLLGIICTRIPKMALFKIKACTILGRTDQFDGFVIGYDLLAKPDDMFSFFNI